MNTYLLYSKKKFFYDFFSESQIPGLFSPEHFIYIAIVLSLLAILIYYSRNITERQYELLHKWLTIVITVLEIIKIGILIYKEAQYDDYIPFYFCGLFIFALWFSSSKIPFLRNTGFAYITMGSILAGLFFTFYPSTSLMLYPVWHPATIHAAFYHTAMVYFGVVTLISRKYTPHKHHAKYYFVFVSIFCVISLVLNKYLGTNCMFLRHPFGLPLLSEIQQWYPPAYVILAWFGQSVALYWVIFWIYNTFFKSKIEKMKAKHYNTSSEQTNNIA